METILSQITSIPGVTFHLHSYISAYSGATTFYCQLRRAHEDDLIEIKRSSEISPLAALQDAWSAFENLVRFGVPQSELAPLLEHQSA